MSRDGMHGDDNVVLFDLDNTLIPFLQPLRRWAEAWAETAQPEDPDPVREALLDVTLEETEDPERAIRVVTDRFELEGTADRASEAARQTYWRELAPYPGVRGSLARLRRKEVPLAVVTDAPRKRAAIRLAATQLTRFFEVVVTRDDTPHGNGKASPRPFQIALDELETGPEHAVMVGDWPAFDIRWPNRLGMRTVLAQWGSGALPDHARCDSSPTLAADEPREVCNVVLDDALASTPAHQASLA